jgi:hypothetical protein
MRTQGKEEKGQGMSWECERTEKTWESVSHPSTFADPVLEKKIQFFVTHWHERGPWSLGAKFLKDFAILAC